MKKVLVGVGIGCGVLVLLAVIGVAVAGYWAKKNLGGAMEATQQMAAQENDLKELNQSYPFTAPASGEVLALQEARLADYFAIRESALPIFKDYEQKAEGLEKKSENGEKPSLSDGLQAANLLAQLVTQTRATYIEHLKKHRMSPSEFHAITTAIYTSTAAESVGQVNKALAGQREATEKALAEVSVQLEDANLTEEERTALQEQETALQAQLEAYNDTGSVPQQFDEKAQGVAAANMALLEKYKDRAQNAYNPAFDSLVLGAEMQGGLGQQAE